MDESVRCLKFKRVSEIDAKLSVKLSYAISSRFGMFVLIKWFTANGSIREIEGAENLVQIGVTSKLDFFLGILRAFSKHSG